MDMSSQTSDHAVSINKFNEDNVEGGWDKKLMAQRVLLWGVIIVITLIVCYIVYTCIKEGYLTESVRSDSDKEGWDLRKAIEKYLFNQNKLLSKRAY